MQEGAWASGVRHCALRPDETEEGAELGVLL